MVIFRAKFDQTEKKLATFERMIKIVSAFMVRKPPMKFIQGAMITAMLCAGRGAGRRATRSFPHLTYRACSYVEFFFFFSFFPPLTDQFKV
jgi:hypothetical protein